MNCVPITTPTNSTSYSTGTAIVNGPGGAATVYGSGTTTTHGSTTSYVPLTINRSDYGAVYFVKLRFGLGVFTRDLNDSERQEMQSNKGAVVRVVVDGSAAFNADILVGDVITGIDGVAVANSQLFNDLLRERGGKTIVISFLRRGQRMEKSVRLSL